MPIPDPKTATDIMKAMPQPLSQPVEYMRVINDFMNDAPDTAQMCSIMAEQLADTVGTDTGDKDLRHRVFLATMTSLIVLYRTLETCETKARKG